MMISTQSTNKRARFASFRVADFADDPQCCPCDLLHYLENVLKKERQHIGNGETLKLTFKKVKSAPELLFVVVGAVADRYRATPDQVMRIVNSYPVSSDSGLALGYGSGDADLDGELTRVCKALKRASLTTQDDDITDIISVPSGYYSKPATKYDHNQPVISIYVGDVDELKESARMAGDKHWSETFLARVCLALLQLDFNLVPSIEDGQKIINRLKAHVNRRRKFLKNRLYGLRGLVPRNDRFWLLEEVPDFVRRHPGATLGAIARHLGIDIRATAERRGLQRSINDIITVGRLQLEGKKYYVVELP